MLHKHARYCSFFVSESYVSETSEFYAIWFSRLKFEVIDVAGSPSVIRTIKKIVLKEQGRIKTNLLLAVKISCFHIQDKFAFQSSLVFGMVVHHDYHSKNQLEMFNKSGTCLCVFFALVGPDIKAKRHFSMVW